MLAREKRGEHLSWLCMFWMIGGIYASAMAWAIIPHYGKKEHLLVICSYLTVKVKILKYSLKKGLHVCSQNTDPAVKKKKLFLLVRIIRMGCALNNKQCIKMVKHSQNPYLVRFFKLLKTWTHKNTSDGCVESRENRCGDLHQRK